MSSLSSSSSRFTCEIVFHRATNVPIGDLNTLSSDPYILATLTSLQHNKSRPEEPISFRTSTVRRTLNPEFDGARWIVSGVPASGFIIVLSLMDEDPGDHDDRLGKAVLRFPDPNRDTDAGKMELKRGWQTGEQEYKIHKRHGGLRARFGTYVAKVVTRGRVGHRTRVMLSVRVLGEALPREHNEDVDKIYTLGPRESPHRGFSMDPYLTKGEQTCSHGISPRWRYASQLCSRSRRTSCSLPDQSPLCSDIATSDSGHS